MFVACFDGLCEWFLLVDRLKGLLKKVAEPVNYQWKYQRPKKPPVVECSIKKKPLTGRPIKRFAIGSKSQKVGDWTAANARAVVVRV